MFDGLKKSIILMALSPFCLLGFCAFADNGSFPLVQNGKAASLVIDDHDAEVVKIAAAAFAEDVKLVTGIRPEISTDKTQSSYVVYAGTYGKNKWIKQLTEAKKLDFSHLIDKPWESFIIAVVDNPFDGIDQALIIAGSDRRGTAYGIFELSQMIGVSPWVWWADVLPEKKDCLYIDNRFHEFGPPSVKYRGVFLNDEDWGLHPWAAKTYEPEVGDIGPKTYARICELLLRLKANHLWPAMHNCTRAFNYYPDNKVVADKYAIVMGSSHCEPLLFNNATEWDSRTMGPWRYDSNRERIIQVLDKRVKENGKYENVYTVGLRGIHDSGMAGESLKEKTKYLKRAIRDQRQILSKYIDTPITEIPQVFIPYKEVLPLYENNLRVADDVTLMWADDNYGYIRQFSNEQEQKRSGGGGIYYHISYLGRPHSYLWLNTTPTALLYKELRRAWETNAREIWILNVGDIKPGEISIEFSLQMAWDINQWNEDNMQNYLVDVSARDFGKEYAGDIATVLNDYFRLNFPRKPEFMDFRKGWNVQTAIGDPAFSLIDDGDECQWRIDVFEALYERAKAIGRKIPRQKADAYFQLVLYPVGAAAKMNEKILDAYKSRVYAKQGRISSNFHAEKATAAFEEIRSLTEYYNNQIAGGKWKHMMSYKPMSETVFAMPPVLTYDGADSKGFAIGIEGQANLLKPVCGELMRGDSDHQSDEIVLKAAEAIVHSNMETQVFNDVQAFGLSNGKGDRLNGPTDAKAVFRFEVKQAGVYEIYLTVDHPSAKDDSWYIQIDDNGWVTWNNRQGKWREHFFEYAYFTTGQHTLTMSAREDGAWFSQARLVRKTIGIDSEFADSDKLPVFNRYTRKKHFIDVVAVNRENLRWQIIPSADWITLSKADGILQGNDERVWVDIDYTKAPVQAKLSAAVRIVGKDADGELPEYLVAIEVFNEDLNIKSGTFIQDNDIITIDAENYAAIHAGKTAEWKSIEGLGYSGKTLGLFPMTGWYIENSENIAATCPRVEYPFYCIKEGSAVLTIQSIPAFSLVKDRPLHCAVSMDEQAPVFVPLKMGSAEGTTDRDQEAIWANNVLKNAMFGQIELDIPHGEHTLKIWGTDPSIILDKIFIDFDKQRRSYLGNVQTVVKK